MNTSDIAQMLEDMTDAEIVSAIETAQADIVEAVAQEPNSEWHQACFAGFMMYAQEGQKRGIPPVRMGRLH